jgi:hypothetical protein
MKFTKTLLALVLTAILVLPACNPGCAAVSAVATATSTFAGQILQCDSAGTASLNSEFTNVIESVVPSFCTATNDGKKLLTGPLANTFCPVIASALVGYVATNTLPAGCSGANLAALTVTKLTSLCELIPVSAPAS